MHWNLRDGCLTLWLRHREWLSVANSFGLGLEVEFPSEWHEDGLGTIRIHLGWPAIYISFPWYRTYPDHYQCCGPRFGFRFFGDLLWIYHGNDTGHRDCHATTTIWMPWHWKHCTHEVLNAQGEWEPFVGSWERDKEPDGRVEETHDYTYVLKSGEVQHRKATIFIERWMWKRRWWWPRRMERRSINVDFDGEVGERTGSWKGGTVGCGYDLLPGEPALECLRRMERERKF